MATLKYKDGDSWIDVLHPVGSFYFSNSNESPSSLFGGTWQQIKNAVIRAGSTTGYEGSDNMTLTVNQMPSHRHSSDSLANSAYWLGYNAYGETNSGSGVNYGSTSSQYSIRIRGGISTATLSELRGGGESFSKLPRTYNIYCWVRTA